MTKKPDADAILGFMGGLAATLPEARSWWPKWIFRSDHVENAAKILNSGALLSRAAAEQDRLILQDAASQTHITELTSELRRYVRLYFRPRTPTNFANEGIRPRSQYEYGGAHMPVPVFLLFSVDLLGERGIRFTRGRLTAGTEIGESLEFLQGTNFADIYHDSGVGVRGSPDRKSHILNARNAEVLAVDTLGLDHLRHIVCRSEPERDTLLSLLEPAAAEWWIRRITLPGRRQLFNTRGTYVEKVDLGPGHSQFTFYPGNNSDWRGPFALRIDWFEEHGPGMYYENETFTVQQSPLRLSLTRTLDRYTVEVRLDGHLAYRGRFVRATKPDIFF